MRLLIYSQDGAGLGHLRRTRNIAHELLARRPDCRVLAIADSPVVSLFRPIAGIEYLELPTIVKTGLHAWRPWTSSQAIREVVKLRTSRILHAFRKFEPDAVLVDHMPVGALGELKPLLDVATKRVRPPKLFLSLRDVLDAPEAIEETWHDLGAYDYLDSYDAVLVHGCQEIFDAVAAYSLSRARRVVFNHYVVPDTKAAGPAPPADDDPLILVTGGGGADAFPLANAFLDSLPSLLKETPLRATIVAGPHMPASARRALAAQAKAHPVRILTMVQDTTPMLRRAAAVVTMAGYNTLAEILQWQRKAVVVPRAGPSAEQRMRGRLFAERQLVRTVEPEALTPNRLAEELLKLLRDGSVPNRSRIPPLDGAPRAAALLVESIGGERKG